MLEKSGAISYDSFLHKIVGFSNPKSAYTVLTNRTLLNFPGETKFNGVSLWGELGPLCSTLSRQVIAILGVIVFRVCEQTLCPPQFVPIMFEGRRSSARIPDQAWWWKAQRR